MSPKFPETDRSPASGEPSIVDEQPWVSTWPILLLHQLGWWVFCAWFYWRVARYKHLFEDLEADLSTGVVLIFQVADLVVQYWYLLPIPLLILGMGDYIIDSLLVTMRRWKLRLYWILLLFLLPLGLWIAMSITLLFTVNALIEDLS